MGLLGLLGLFGLEIPAKRVVCLTSPLYFDPVTYLEGQPDIQTYIYTYTYMRQTYINIIDQKTDDFIKLKPIIIIIIRKVYGLTR